MKLLLTGHSGFVGTNLIHAFQSDFDLYGLDIAREDGDLHGSDLSPHESFPPEKIFSWDDLAAIPPVDAIIHLAGKAHDTANVSDPQEYFDVNLGLTKQIFDWFLASQAQTFIFFSSVKAVADTVTGPALTEEAVPDPKTPYGQSKLAAEEYITKALSASKGDSVLTGLGLSPIDSARDASKGDSVLTGPGLSTASKSTKRIFILRPCMIHGPGNKGNLNLLYKVVRKGIPWPLGAFDNRRSFVSIDNVAHVIRQLLEKEITPGTYNLADDEPVSTSQLISMMAASMGRKPHIWKLPAGLIRGMARLGDILHLPLNSERLKKLTESYVVSNEKLKKALGVTQMPIPAREGMMQTLKSFSTHNQ